MSSVVPMAIGELFGPVVCEHEGCQAYAWIIWMTPDEYDTAKKQTERHPVGYVFENRIGLALCNNHVPQRFSSDSGEGVE